MSEFLIKCPCCKKWLLISQRIDIEKVKKYVEKKDFNVSRRKAK